MTLISEERPLAMLSFGRCAIISSQAIMFARCSELLFTVPSCTLYQKMPELGGFLTMLRTLQGVAILGELALGSSLLVLSRWHACVYPHSCNAPPLAFMLLLAFGPGLLLLLLGSVLALSLSFQNMRWSQFQSLVLAAALTFGVFLSILAFNTKAIPSWLLLCLIAAGTWWMYSLVTFKVAPKETA